MTKYHFSPFLHADFTKATQIRRKLTYIQYRTVQVKGVVSAWMDMKIRMNCTGREPNPQDESKPSQYYAYGEAESSGTYTEPVYGEGDETNGWYRAYEETPKPRKEGSGFAKKLVKCAAFALTFGLVAGLAFAGTTYFFRNVTGEDRLSAKEEKKASGGDLHIIDATEAADPISGSAKAGSA